MSFVWQHCKYKCHITSSDRIIADLRIHNSGHVECLRSIRDGGELMRMYSSYRDVNQEANCFPEAYQPRDMTDMIACLRKLRRRCFNCVGDSLPSGSGLQAVKESIVSTLLREGAATASWTHPTQQVGEAVNEIVYSPQTKIPPTMS